MTNKWHEYHLAVERSKDIAAMFGIYSEQYKQAILNMEVEFLIVKKTRLEKLMIWLGKRKQ